MAVATLPVPVLGHFPLTFPHPSSGGRKWTLNVPCLFSYTEDNFHLACSSGFIELNSECLR